MDKRAERGGTISGFLTTAGWGSAARTALAGDASFRRYWRLTDGARRAVLMDAPPDKLDIRPFLAIDAHLRGLDSSAPEILAADPATGLALLEDLGDATLAQRLDAGDDPDRIFGLAIDWVIDLHRRGAAAIPAGLPAYDDARLLEEVERFLLWYVPAARGTPVDEDARQNFEAIWRALLPTARTVPATMVHRDFFVENLLVLPRPGLTALGLLDFQDAVVGPITYDLASLLEDARRDLPATLIDAMRARYRAAFPQLSGADFDASWAVMAAHRHVKCLGLFVRLAKRDSKPGYLRHIPRLWRLLGQALTHPALHELAHWLEREVPAARRVVPTYERGSMTMPGHAMVLAAGLGLRMRPRTKRTPKPLIPVAGRSMLDRVFDRLDEAGVPNRVVNTHWLADKIARHLANHSGVILSHEDVLLETGGGVAHALPLLGAQPFFVCNADIIWLDGARPALIRLAEAWDTARMDALLLLEPVGRAFGYEGPGDFFRADDGRLQRRGDASTAPFVFTGVQILHPQLFTDAPDGEFSLNILYDRAQATRRLFGLVHEGDWLHIGTPETLTAAESWFAAHAGRA